MRRLSDLVEAMGPVRLPRRYCPAEPTPKQELLLRRTDPEVFFGGAVGGAKTWGLCMSALQYADVPGYHAMVLRPVYGEFFIPRGIHELFLDWLSGSGAAWVGSPIPQWRFPGGASVTYGYLGSETAVDRYKGGELSRLCFDELVGFGLREYLGMRRLLRSTDRGPEGLPSDVRAASNPSTSRKTRANQAWIKQRLVDPRTRADGACFIASRLEDNVHVDREEYLAKLMHLLPADRRRLVEGDWDASEEGSLFRREWFRVVPAAEVSRPKAAARYWDLAATEPGPENLDPDYTIGLRLEVDAAGTFTVRDIVRGRWPPHVVEALMAQTAAADGRGVRVGIEQEPGASGVSMVSHVKRQVLRGYAVRGVRPSGDKETRAVPVAAAAGNGLVQVVEGCPNLLEFLDEVGLFGAGGGHDDCVDALSGAHEILTTRAAFGSWRSSVPRGRIQTAATARATVPAR